MVVHHHIKPPNPFSPRGTGSRPHDNVSPHPTMFLQQICLVLVMAAFFVSILSLALPIREPAVSLDATIPARTTTLVLRHAVGGGLRGQSKLRPAASTSFDSNTATAAQHQQLANVPVPWEQVPEEDDRDEDDDENSRVEPEDQVLPNKQMVEAKEIVKQENEEIHAEFEGHVFGENRTGVEMLPIAEEDPQIVITENRGAKKGEEPMFESASGRAAESNESSDLADAEKRQPLVFNSEAKPLSDGVSSVATA